MHHAQLFHPLDSINQHRRANFPQNQHQRRPRHSQSEMRACVHDVIIPARALHNVLHLRYVGLFQLHRRSAQAVRAANLLHRLRRNPKRPVPRAKQNHLLRILPAPRLRLIVGGDLHRAPTGASAAIFATARSIDAAMSSSASTSFTAPVLIASAGIPKIADVASSCAITNPPFARMLLMPFEASAPIPVSTTPTVCARAYAAALSSATSAHGIYPSIRAPSSRAIRPSAVSRKWLAPGHR